MISLNLFWGKPSLGSGICLSKHLGFSSLPSVSADVNCICIGEWRHNHIYSVAHVGICCSVWIYFMVDTSHCVFAILELVYFLFQFHFFTCAGISVFFISLNPILCVGLKVLHRLTLQEQFMAFSYLSLDSKMLTFVPDVKSAIWNISGSLGSHMKPKPSKLRLYLTMAPVFKFFYSLFR